jgi:hypothetical protein
VSVQELEQAVPLEELSQASPVGEPPEAVQAQAPSVKEMLKAPPLGEGGMARVGHKMQKCLCFKNGYVTPAWGRTN